MFQLFSTRILAMVCVGASVLSAAAQDNGTSLPDRWAYTPVHSMEIPDGHDSWWSQFGDTTLDSLINLGVERNYNLDIAMRRMAVARAAVGQARSGLMPTVNLDAGWTKSRTSGDMIGVGQSATTSYFNAGVSASWEIDIFGRITSGVKAKKAAYVASKAEYAGTMLSLSAQIASTYVELRKYQALAEVANNHAEAQLKIAVIANARYEATLASKLDVVQANETYYATLATLPQLQNAINSAINALAVLVGEYPSQIKPMLETPAPLPDHARIIGPGIPADLLRRRPDIAQAEAEMASYAAAAGVARKDFLPTLTINGSIGTAAHRLDDLFTSNSLTYSIQPTLSFTLFDGLGRTYALQSAREQLQMGIDNYQQTILSAIEEVDNAISGYNHAILYADAIDKVLEQNRESVRLSLERYKSALSPMTDVVNAQINALNAESNRISAQADALSALISLYEALGGGYINE